MRFTNATGHYELGLSTKVHQALACRLKDVAHSEPEDAANWVNVIYEQYTATTKARARARARGRGGGGGWGCGCG